ncbi:MAG: LysR family transcriptional regulator [Aquificae bacterium]|nr:LysR family transcriptional regulator [Aquificota bacterium]
MKLKYKIWFEKDGQAVITDLKYKILKEIDRTKSVKKAAERLGISYKKALGHIKAMEERLKVRVVERKRGKGATLTEAGKDLVEKYEEVQKLFENIARLFEEK